jgi:hypothetical protein
MMLSQGNLMNGGWHKLIGENISGGKTILITQF